MITNVRISGDSPNPRQESDIRLNYSNPSEIIAACNDDGSFLQVQCYSKDGGANWNQTNLPLAPGDVGQSDPAVDWTSDADGTAWAATLGMHPSQPKPQWRLRIYKSIDKGQTWTLDATPSGTATNVDRDIMWVDHSLTSPYKDQIYLTYYLGSPAFVVRRTAGADGAWQTPVQVSGAETTGTAIGGDIKTNALGDVFVFWPDTGGTNKILVVKSTNGGASFGALGATPVPIGTVFASTRMISIPAFPRTLSGPAGMQTVSSRGARVYISGAAYRNETKDLAYAMWADLSGEPGCTTGEGPGTDVKSTCKSRIWFSRSTDGGAHWSMPLKLQDQSSLNDQFHPRLVLDESNGNLAVVYHDTVNDPKRVKTDLWMQASTDDGVTWGSPFKVTTAQTDETGAGTNQWKYGDYLGFSGFSGTFFPAWTDRRGGNDEIWTAAVPISILFPIGVTEVEIDLLALIFGVTSATYIRWTLPDPPPIDVVTARIRKLVQAMGPEEKMRALAQAKALSAYSTALEKELSEG